MFLSISGKAKDRPKARFTVILIGITIKKSYLLEKTAFTAFPVILNSLPSCLKKFK
jgi:hypothetical protein